MLLLSIAVLLGVGAIMLWSHAHQGRGDSSAPGRTGARMHDGPALPNDAPGSLRRAAVPELPAELRALDRDDLAAYVRPGDPEPTGAQVIAGLQEAGIRTGLGAFNPPGTSPPLEGLAVPADFPLPPGYVSHHQVTDAGEPVEPILMFAPDAVFRDPDGRPIPLPENRVVPPELAPPGLPLRRVRIPKP